jgi:hypothetical protein
MKVKMWMNQLNRHHRTVLLSSCQWVSGSERASPGAGTLPGSGMSYEHLRGFLYWDGIFKLLSSPGIDSATLCSQVAGYGKPIPTRCQTLIDCSKIPAQIFFVPFISGSYHLTFAKLFSSHIIQSAYFTFYYYQWLVKMLKTKYSVL